MLQKLVDFFKNLFSGLFGSKDKKAPEIKVTENFHELELEEQQDGSEIRPDTAVVVVNETEPILVDQGNDDLTNEPPPSAWTMAMANSPRANALPNYPMEINS